MSNNDGKKMMEAFLYVRDVYANASRMLYSSDDIMHRQKLHPYADWDAIWPNEEETGILAWNDWLPYYVMRQYHSEDRENVEVVTLAAVFWDACGDGIDEPLLVASRMDGRDLEGNDVYWLSLYQLWLDDYPPDGKVRTITSASMGWEKEPNDLDVFKDVVDGDRMLSLAVPLVEITDLEQLETRIIAPLMAEPFVVEDSLKTCSVDGEMPK
jgi:hypothetical protein